MLQFHTVHIATQYDAPSFRAVQNASLDPTCEWPQGLTLYLLITYLVSSLVFCVFLILLFCYCFSLLAFVTYTNPIIWIPESQFHGLLANSKK